MDDTTLVDEIDEMIGRIETLNSAQLRGRKGAHMQAMSSSARRLFKARQARLWWLRQVRSGMLAKRTKSTKLH